MVVSEKTTFDLKHVIEYPITPYPLSLAHSDGAHLKTAKSALLNKLEDLQTDALIDLPVNCARVYDGSLLLHSVLSSVNIMATYGSIARTILSTVCTGTGTEVHVCLDKYIHRKLDQRQRKAVRARANWPLCSATGCRVFVAGIFIPVGNHYFQALASTLQFVAQVCDRLWARPRHRQIFLWLQ